jgi:hypothetical protein
VVVCSCGRGGAVVDGKGPFGDDVACRLGWWWWVLTKVGSRGRRDAAAVVDRKRPCVDDGASGGWHGRWRLVIPSRSRGGVWGACGRQWAWTGEVVALAVVQGFSLPRLTSGGGGSVRLFVPLPLTRLRRWRSPIWVNILSLGSLSLQIPNGIQAAYAHLVGPLRDVDLARYNGGRR